MFDKECPPDKYLYHYTKLEIALEKIIPNQTLKLGLISATNDPRESKDWFFIPIDGRVGETPLSSELMKITSAGLRKGCKVLCLSSDCNYSKGYCLPRMWAQYTDNNRGVCLVLNKHSLIVSAKKQLKAKGTVYMEKVKYTAHLDSHLSFSIDMQKYDAGNYESLWDEMVKKYWKHYFFKKHADWKKEQEYRIVLRDKRDIKEDIPEFLSIDGTLEAIIFGVDCPTIYSLLVKNLCFERKIGCYKMKWINGNPSIYEI
jgi:hypothetical protein